MTPVSEQIDDLAPEMWAGTGFDYPVSLIRLWVINQDLPDFLLRELDEEH